MDRSSVAILRLASCISFVVLAPALAAADNVRERAGMGTPPAFCGLEHPPVVDLSSPDLAGLVTYADLPTVADPWVSLMPVNTVGAVQDAADTPCNPGDDSISLDYFGDFLAPSATGGAAALVVQVDGGGNYLNAWDPAALAATFADLSLSYSPDAGIPNVASDKTVVSFTPCGVTAAPEGVYKMVKLLELPQGLSNRRAESVGSQSRVAVTIHGWNPDRVIDNYQLDDPENPAGVDQSQGVLSESLQLVLDFSANWELATYHWERDAATGPLFDFAPGEGGVRNGTQAAEVGYQHGLNLGKQLVCLPDLEFAHLLSHSAGAWVARSAAKMLHEWRPEVQVQITLLDPYIPAAAAEPSTLGIPRLEELEGLPAVRLLENYVSDDFFVFGTNETIDGWDLGVNLWVDVYEDGFPGPSHYDGHSGPTLWYARTVVDNGWVPQCVSPGGCEAFELNGWELSRFFAEEFAGLPKPVIKGNGVEDAISLPFGDPLTVSVELDPSTYLFELADWWIGMLFLDFDGTWKPLFMDPIELLLVPVADTPLIVGAVLPPGVYRFVFGVELDPEDTFESPAPDWNTGIQSFVDVTVN